MIPDHGIGTAVVGASLRMLDVVAQGRGREIAGLANPVGTLRSAVTMLDHLGGTARPEEVTDALVSQLRR